MASNRPPVKPDLFPGDLSEERLNEYLTDDRLAVDCEMMGLNPRRDRLCVVQICDSRNRVSLVQILPEQKEAPRLKRLFENSDIIKVFHFARMDTLFLRYRLGIETKGIFCTKIASKLARTYTDRHGLKDIIREFFDEILDKKNQSSDWGAKILTKDQIDYASGDVLFLISLEQKLTQILLREGRFDLAQECFACLPVFNQLDWLEMENLFEH
ncbi:3'-5' exonuclease [Leptospira fainei serovar Hurstbridge str. BUT 6]|uniref:3'-5' exonuclease n=1 Tax=Leptospira fainei serovar Hurstbridge str. BUT 6 TaxID=1193011 RepID=S3V1E6_9LEPT|nr:3'-5' exonuclease [Leptospira fainei]EPG76486.1 3'-5' exonuclease [Leptospira fainei serovar Hurstbridge str. BUT 6]